MRGSTTGAARYEQALVLLLERATCTIDVRRPAFAAPVMRPLCIRFALSPRLLCERCASALPPLRVCCAVRYASARTPHCFRFVCVCSVPALCWLCAPCS